MLRPMKPRALLVLAAAVSLTSVRPAIAEDTAPPRRPKPSDGFRFSPPEEPATPAATAAPAGGKKPEPVPLDATGAAIRRLSTWPGQDGVRAAETLLLMGPDAVDALFTALVSGSPAVKPGAAWVLGKSGSPSHVPGILRAAAERTNGSRLETFF